MNNNNRRIGDKLKQEARVDLREENSFKNRRINVGERITDAMVQEDKEISKTIKRGIKEIELTEVLEQILNDASTTLNPEAYKELRDGVVSKFALSAVITDQEIQLAPPLGIGPIPIQETFTTVVEYEESIKQYNLKSTALTQAWAKERISYIKDVTNQKGIILRNHISEDVLKPIKRKKTEFSAIEDSASLVKFMKLLMAAIKKELGWNTVSEERQLYKEITESTVKQTGCAITYLNNARELIDQYKTLMVNKKNNTMRTAGLTEEDIRLRKQENIDDIQQDVNQDNTIINAIYNQIKFYGLDHQRKAIYEEDDVRAEVPKEDNRFTFRVTKQNVELGGLDLMLEAVETSLSMIKDENPQQMINFRNWRFKKDLNINVTGVNRIVENPCIFCEKQLKIPHIANLHDWYHCKYNPTCKLPVKYVGDEEKQKRLDGVNRPKTSPNDKGRQLEPDKSED